MMRLIPLVLAACLLVTGCSTNPATGRGTFTAFMSPDDERRIGDDVHPRLVTEFGGPYPDPLLQAYVQALGQSLVRVSETPETSYTFVILDDPSVNAFALPGGYVHITRGLLALADSEAELAGVLAHEIGHLVARHPAERYSQAVAVGMRLSGASEGEESADTPVIGFADEARRSLRTWTRRQEYEADLLGIRYLRAAGYDPAAMVTFLEKMDALSALQVTEGTGSGLHGRAMETHPRTTDRVRRAADRVNGSDGAAKHNRDRYLSMIDGLVWGEDPRHGLQVGAEFQHPDLEIAFRVPAGFEVINRPTHVTAQGPDGSLMVFDMVPSPSADRADDLEAYVADDWGKSLGLRAVEPMEINGMDAVTAANRVRLDNDLVDVRLVAVRERPGRTYRFMFFAPAMADARVDTDFRLTTLSFRRLTSDEVDAVAPQRVRVVTVQEGETVDDFASRMGPRPKAADWFRLINGLGADARLDAGSRVKVVTR